MVVIAGISRILDQSRADVQTRAAFAMRQANLAGNLKHKLERFSSL
jgi:hypothetical protein